MCAGDKEMWEGMLQIEADDIAGMVAVQERIKRHVEREGRKKGRRERKEKELNMGMGLQLLFGGEGRWVG